MNYKNIGFLTSIITVVLVLMLSSCKKPNDELKMLYAHNWQLTDYRYVNGAIFYSEPPIPDSIIKHNSIQFFDTGRYIMQTGNSIYGHYSANPNTNTITINQYYSSTGLAISAYWTKVFLATIDSAQGFKRKR